MSLFGSLFGGGKSSTAPGKVWGTQAPYLEGLYKQASGLAGQQMGSIGGYAGRLANNLMNGYAQQNPYISQQIQGFGQDLGNQFMNQILPGIQSSAGIAGQFGGSRQSVAAGMAGQDLMNQFSRGAADIRSNAYDTTMQNLPNLYNLGMSQFNAPWMPMQNLAASLGGATVLGGGGSSSGPGMFNGMFNGFFGGG